MDTTRRDFIKKTGVVTAGLAFGSLALSAKSYKRILGANDRVNVAIMGLGRRLFAFYEPIIKASNNIELTYLCDVMPSQIERAAKKFSSGLDYAPKQESDIRKVLEDKNLDAIFNATPDHWHAPGSIMAMKEGKHVYVEKPCSHNMFENEMLVEASKKYNKLVQVGTQQRSSTHTIQIISDIHNGIIGTPYKAVAFYTNKRGRVPNQTKSAIPGGLNWELFQGPAPRREYTAETWNYNWHWYGWDYGTAEVGNNATHELDLARWALQVDFPSSVYTDAGKGQFIDDGWEMYDHMEVTFKFKDNKTIKWDGRSRNGYDTYNGGRGVIIYGSKGSVFLNRGKYILYDLSGKVIKNSEGNQDEAGNALGGGGDMSTRHVENFINAIRGTETLTAPISDSAMSNAMVHYTNVAYRINNGFNIDDKGKMLNDNAMDLWKRNYEPGWEVTI